MKARAIEITGRRIGDGPMLPELLAQIPPDEAIGLVTADGAHDTRGCHAAIAARHASATIPSRRNGRPGKRPPPEPRRATRSYAPPSVWVDGSGAPGAAVTDEVGGGQDGVPQAPGRAPHGPHLPSSDHRAPHPHRPPQPLRPPRHPRDAARCTMLTGITGGSTSGRLLNRAPQTPEPPSQLPRPRQYATSSAVLPSHRRCGAFHDLRKHLKLGTP